MKLWYVIVSVQRLVKRCCTLTEWTALYLTLGRYNGSTRSAPPRWELPVTWLYRHWFRFHNHDTDIKTTEVSEW